MLAQYRFRTDKPPELSAAALLRIFSCLSVRSIDPLTDGSANKFYLEMIHKALRQQKVAAPTAKHTKPQA